MAASREWLFIVQESAYKTPAASLVTWPTSSPNSWYVRLDGGNAFTMRPKPLQKPIMYGGGFAVPAFTVSDQTELKGRLVTKLYAATAPLFLNWAMTRVNAAQTSPWTTTEPVGDLASCSVYHAIVRSDGTVKRRVYLGTKVTGWSLECSADAQVATLSLDLQASTPQGNQFDSSVDPTTTVFPDPTDHGTNNFSSDPYLFIHTAGNLSIGSTRTQYSSVKIDVTNAIDARFFENRYVNIIRFLGRSSTLGAKLYYKPTPDDRTTFEGLTAQSLSLTFNNTTHTSVFTFNAQNVYKDLNDDLPLDKVYEQDIMVGNYFDPAAGTAGADITYSST